MKTIRRNGSIEAFHDWRRQVKYHRYHLDLLQPARPQELVSRIALADRIGESLGDDHDMSELIARLRRAPRNAVPKKTRRYAGKLAASVGRRLRDHALEDAPETINAAPYGDGWIVRIKASEPVPDTLLDATDYAALVAEEG